jgi:hypothetical protein
MKKKIDRFICDQCGKMVDQEDIQFGGSPFHGWYTLDKVIGGTSVMHIEGRRSWPRDYCCKECLSKALEEE